MPEASRREVDAALEKVAASHRWAYRDAPGDTGEKEQGWSDEGWEASEIRISFSDADADEARRRLQIVQDALEQASARSLWARLARRMLRPWAKRWGWIESQRAPRASLHIDPMGEFPHNSEEDPIPEGAVADNQRGPE